MPRTLLFDRSNRLRLRIGGPQGAATLNGLVTNDLAALAPGTGCYAAVLTSKGKIVADLRIFRLADGATFLLDTSARAAPGLGAMFAKYVNPRFATVTDVTGELCDLGVFGDRAPHVVASAVGERTAETIETLPPYAQRTVSFDGVDVTVARVPDLGVVGYELFVPLARRDQLYDALHTAGATPADAEQWRTLRVAAGWPEWGADMDDNTLLQEANFDELQGVSYTKGCYIGQETVARIHFRGHVNKTLRRLAFDAEGADEAMPLSGAALVDADDVVVGEIRSTARLPGGEVLGIGVVRQTVGTGATLTTKGGRANGEVGAERLISVRVLGLADGAAAENARGAIG